MKVTETLSWALQPFLGYICNIRNLIQEIMKLYLVNLYFEAFPNSDCSFDFSPHGLTPNVKASEKSRFVHLFVHSFAQRMCIAKH